jgi:hypothetical protein
VRAGTSDADPERGDQRRGPGRRDGEQGRPGEGLAALARARAVPVLSGAIAAAAVQDDYRTFDSRPRSGPDPRPKAGSTLAYQGVRIRFGAHGLHPHAGPPTNHFGGNTACVEVCGRPRHHPDCGTGARPSTS